MSLDKIILNEMQFFGYHGVSVEEKKFGSQFVIHLELYLDLYIPSSTDAISDTVDYSQVFEVVRSVIEGNSQNLVETLCNNIGMKIILRFPLVEAVTVRVSKQNPPIGGGILRSAGVEMMIRSQGN